MTYQAIVGDILLDKEAGVASIPRDSRVVNLETDDPMVAMDRADKAMDTFKADGFIVPDLSVYRIVYR